MYDETSSLNSAKREEFKEGELNIFLNSELTGLSEDEIKRL